MAINANQLEQLSYLRLRREVIPNPLATTANKLVASVDPSTLTAGAALTLAASVSGLLMLPGRKPTLVLTDASGGGGGLAVTVTVFGTRFGQPVQCDITTTCTSGSATTAIGSVVMDQVTAIIVRSITTAATGDALTCGISGDGLGLSAPIDAVNDVVSIVKIVSGTQATPIAISSTTVDVANSAINHGGTITAANDTFVVTYKASLQKDGPGLGQSGVFA